MFRRPFLAAFSLLLITLISGIASGQSCALTDPGPFNREVFGKIKAAPAPPRDSGKLLTIPTVRFIYLVPSDRSVRDDYKAAIADAALQLQDFYQRQLGSNYAFSLHTPIVESYQTSQTAAWYKTHVNGGDSKYYFYLNTLAEGNSRTGGYENDPYNRWIYIIDAEPTCCQGAGGTNGVAVLHGGDLRGLTGQQDIMACYNANPSFPGCPGSENNAGKYRYIGGLGHELGHAFGLPHPPGCDLGFDHCEGGAYAGLSLMYLGYGLYPNTYLLSDEENFLLTDTDISPFFSQIDLREPRVVDFDADRKSDISTWRPSDLTWRILPSSGARAVSTTYGASGDQLAPGDYDGDNKTDIAVWRPGDGTWYILQSNTATVRQVQFGTSGDVAVARDYDGDRLADLAVWRSSSTMWWISLSATGVTQSLIFGTSGDKPVPADYDGDKRADIALFRPSNNYWYTYKPYLSYYYYTTPHANGNVIYTSNQYGLSGDILVPGDYDGDGIADRAIYRPSTGVWWLDCSTAGSENFSLGISTDVPVPGDYDNDGIYDVAVWRSSNHTFYIRQSSTTNVVTQSWGATGDIPIEAAFTQ